MKQDALLEVCGQIQRLLAVDCGDRAFERSWCAVKKDEGCAKYRSVVTKTTA